MREVLLLGNPILWWSGLLALIAAVVAAFKTRDWRWALPLLGVAATWLPWFISSGRPIFSFYAVVTIPFTIIAISLVVSGLAAATETPRQRYALWLIVGALLTAVIVAFWYFHPIYTDDLISYDAWRGRMWFDRWI